MSILKVAHIGAGSFVFGPGVLAGAILEHRMGDVELALMDVDRETVELMAAVGRRVARDEGLATRLTAHTDRASALDGADFVICSAAPEMQKRHAMDCRIIDEWIPGHLVTEFGGIAGISYSLRQIAFITQVAADMRRVAPRAWLLNAANPLPRVCQAAHESGVPTVGFCSVSIAGYARLWQMLRGQSLGYPFKEAQEAYDATMAGLNHFSWILELRDRATGADCMADLRARLAAGASSDSPRANAIARQTGYLLAAGDEHSRDFLPPEGPTPASHQLWHGNPEERRRRLDLMKNVSEGRLPWRGLLSQGAWEKPMDLVAAMACGQPVEFNSLNLINGGQIPNLPTTAFVETRCAGSRRGPVPQATTLPAKVLPFCQRTAQVTDTIVRAAMNRSRRLVHEAVELDPTIVDKPAGVRAVDACLEAHKDAISEYR